MSGSTLLPFFEYSRRDMTDASKIRRKGAQHHLDIILSFLNDYMDKFLNEDAESVRSNPGYIDVTSFERDLRSVRLGELEKFLDNFVAYCKAPIRKSLENNKNNEFEKAQRDLLLALEKDPAITLRRNFKLMALASLIVTAFLLFRAILNIQEIDEYHDSKKSDVFVQIVFDCMLAGMTFLLAAFALIKDYDATMTTGASASNENFLEFLGQASTACEVARPKLKMPLS